MTCNDSIKVDGMSDRWEFLSGDMDQMNSGGMWYSQEEGTDYWYVLSFDRLDNCNKGWYEAVG